MLGLNCLPFFIGAICGIAILDLLECLWPPTQTLGSSIIIVFVMTLLYHQMEQGLELRKQVQYLQNTINDQADRLAISLRDKENIIRERDDMITSLRDSHEKEIKGFKSDASKDLQRFWGRLQPFFFKNEELGRQFYEDLADERRPQGPAMPHSHALALAHLHDREVYQELQYEHTKELKSKLRFLESRVKSLENSIHNCGDESCGKALSKAKASYSGKLDSLNKEIEILKKEKEVFLEKEKELLRKEEELQFVLSAVEEENESLKASKYQDLIQYAKDGKFDELNTIFDAINKASGGMFQPYMQERIAYAFSVGLITLPQPLQFAQPAAFLQPTAMPEPAPELIQQPWDFLVPAPTLPLQPQEATIPPTPTHLPTVTPQASADNTFSNTVALGNPELGGFASADPPTPADSNVNSLPAPAPPKEPQTNGTWTATLSTGGAQPGTFFVSSKKPGTFMKRKRSA